MKQEYTIGFPISHKENEYRRTVVPEDLKKTAFANRVYIEEGYGRVLGISDVAYQETGCQICSRDQVLEQTILCDPKAGDADYLKKLKPGTILFGWIHATQNRDLTDLLLERRLTVFAWEKMYQADRHVFWQNNVLAGEAAVLHAFQCFGQLPFQMEIAVLGRGNTASGAVKALKALGACVTQYTRQTEASFREQLSQYDVVVNCVLWDLHRTDHIIYRSDLSRMKKNALIIDVSCDKHGAIETSIPTSIAEPVYWTDGVCHYVVDHTPAIFYKTFSYQNSKVIMPYIARLLDYQLDSCLQDALIIQNGKILDTEIVDIQRREQKGKS